MSENPSILQKAIKAMFGSPPSGKFGTFSGVFTPSILTILGVIMFLRFPWVVGHAGLLGAVLIVIIAHTLTLPTALSVSSIATNRTVKGGGDYYMLSRSIGLEIGGAIGIGLFFAQALSVALYVLGFTEALINVFPSLSGPVTSIVTVILVAGLAFWDTSLALKTQYIIMALIVLSLVSVFTGQGPNPPGHIELWGTTVDGKPPEPFVKVFAVFFPAVTGFTQGVSMSGDLQDPKRSIPLGTMAAVAVGFVVYLGLMVWLGIQVRPGDLRNIHHIVFKDIARWGFVVTLGIWGATLSSAMGSILGAPRILQALAQDGIVPRFLGKGHGPTNMPRVATVFSLLVAIAGLALAYTSPSGLNAIAAVITMFFLASYGFESLACGLAKWSKLPSFRPTFQVPAAISLFGAAGCFYMMSLISLPAMIAAVIIVGGIYMYLQKKKLTKTWGDMRHGIWSALVRSGLRVLRDVEYHSINWQPHVLVLGGSPMARPHLLHMGRWIGENRGIVTYFVLVVGDPVRQGRRRADVQKTLQRSVRRFFPLVFAKAQLAPTVYDGIMAVAQSYGVATFEPNIILMGWARDESKSAEFADLVKSLIGLDKSILFLSYKDTPPIKIDPTTNKILSQADIEKALRRAGKKARKKGNRSFGMSRPGSSMEVPSTESAKDSLVGRSAVEALTEIQGFGKCRSIDIWWGGQDSNGTLMLLLASLITEVPCWSGAKVFLKMIVPEGAPLSETRRRLEEIITESRVPAEAEIIMRQPPGKPIADIIAERSNADLVMLGMRAPGEDDDGVAFVRRINSLVERLPTTILVRASSDLEHAEVLAELDWSQKRQAKTKTKAEQAHQVEPGTSGKHTETQKNQGSDDPEEEPVADE